jgi:hypothetical protein
MREFLDLTGSLDPKLPAKILAGIAAGLRHKTVSTLAVSPNSRRRQATADLRSNNFAATVPDLDSIFNVLMNREG